MSEVRARVIWWERVAVRFIWKARHAESAEVAVQSRLSLEKNGVLDFVVGSNYVVPMVELSLEPISPPLVAETDGVIRVGGTRVTLDSVVYAFVNGAAAEEIAVQFPSLSLADIYTAISYFLNHRSEVERYLEERRTLAEETKAGNESKFDPVGVRGRLLARK